MKTYILHHGNCQDGFGAAWSAWCKFGTEAEYLPCVYGKEIPEVPAGSRVYMIDYSGTKEQMEALYKHTNGNLVILDHHKSAEEALKDLPYAKFDMNKSGALLAWEYFFPGEPVPNLIKHISDRDLWTFKLDGTKELSVALFSYPYDFKVWDELAAKTSSLKAEGGTLLRYQDQLVSMICDKAYEGEIAGHKVMMVNATSHWSEVGNYLCMKYPNYKFCASYYTDKDGKKWSLRSIGEFDVSAVAKQLGGGGHRNASGFVEKS